MTDASNIMPIVVDNTSNNVSETSLTSAIDDQFRRVFPSSREARGRSIAHILYDRSIKGPFGSGGKRSPVLDNCDGEKGSNGEDSPSGRSDCNLSSASPSSVIRSRSSSEDMDGHEHEDRLNNTGHDNDVDSLSLVLKDSLSEEPAGDSLSDILTHPENEQPQQQNQSQSQPATRKMPPRLKMDAYPSNHSTEIKNYAEYYSVTKFKWNYLSLKSKNEHPHQRHNNTQSDTAVSTISIAFSPDGRTVASTHGDHTVKITCCNTGALIRNLEGHPRTPWTVKYHPTNSNIVASGCLGFQVRVWDWNYRNRTTAAAVTARNSNSTQNNNQESEEEQYSYHNGRGVCLRMIRLQNSIISLSFHPCGSLLAVASGHCLHLWVYDDVPRNDRNKLTTTNDSSSHGPRSTAQDDNNNNNQQNENGNNSSGGNGTGANQNNSTNSRTPTTITQIKYEHNLRCVHFPPGGDTIILGGVNPSQGDTSYSLRLWDFDLEVALNPQLYLGREGNAQRSGEELTPRSPRREALKNFITFVPRALLYNDGGFDVSPDGTKLCGCAEYWLPFGVNSAMEYKEKQEEMAWMEDEKKSRNGCNDSNVDNKEATNNNQNHVNMRHPRRKMTQPHIDQGEKRRKDVDTSRSKEQNSSNQINNNDDDAYSPQERREVRSGDCRTPPNPIRPPVLTSPPSPPGRRWNFPPMTRRDRPSGMRQLHQNYNPDDPAPPSLPPSQHSGSGGRFVPHVVVVSLDKNGKLGDLLEATPLGSRASSVTCVKFSPSAEFCLLGYGVREHAIQPHGQQYHPVTALYRIRGGISHVATMLSGDDDVNIARFHPHSGVGFVYGTKQGRVRVLSPRPWNQYYE